MYKALPSKLFTFVKLQKFQQNAVRNCSVVHEANIKHSYHEHDYKIIADVHYNNKEDALKYRYTTNVPAIDGPVPPLVQAKLEGA